MNNLEERVKAIEDSLAILEKSDRYTFQKTIEILNGRNIQVGLSVGTKIGTASTQKLSVYGVTPIVQQSAISNPSGGITQDTESRNAIGDIINALKNFGITH